MRLWFARRKSGESTTAPAPQTVEPKASLPIDALHIFVLVSFAIAQPVYDRVRERLTFLMDLRLGIAALAGLAVLLSVAVPGAIVLLERIVRSVRPQAYRATHLAVMCTLLLLLVLPFVKRIEALSGVLALGIAVPAAVFATWCYASMRSVRSIVTCATPGLVLFPTLFLYSTTAGLSAGGPSAERLARWRPAPVVMLVLDELSGTSLLTPERQINARRFPHFAALARSSTWFRNATSSHPDTERALPIILSGRFSNDQAVPLPADHPQNLFSVLDVAGDYEIAAFEPVSRLAPQRLPDLDLTAPGHWRQMQFFVSTLWRVYLFHITPIDYFPWLPPIPNLWFGLGNRGEDVNVTARRGVFRYSFGDKRNEQFQHFLNCIDGSDRPALYFMHALLPHVPWCYLPSGRRYLEDGSDWHIPSFTTHSKGYSQWGQDELEVLQGQQRYLLQLMYLDSQIGRLIARLKATGLYDRCLLIVTADHGVSFRVNLPRRVIVPDTIDEILSIPMFIKRPGQVEGEINDRAVESIDLLPTIADVLGIRLYGDLGGWSMFDESRPERQSKRYGDKEGKQETVSPAIIPNSIAPQVWQQRFGDGSDAESMFRIGSLPPLTGFKVASLKQSSASPLKIELTQYGDEVNDQAVIQVPCLYDGVIKSNVPLTESPIVLAVAVNGMIRGVTRTYQQAGFLNRWSVLVPESAYHDGKNDVRFYRITGAGPDWELTPCATELPAK